MLLLVLPRVQDGVVLCCCFFFLFLSPLTKIAALSFFVQTYSAQRTTQSKSYLPFLTPFSFDGGEKTALFVRMLLL